MNKKLLLGALIGAGMSLLNKKKRQQSPSVARGVPRPDFSQVPSPDPIDLPGTSAAGASAGGRPAGGDIFGGAAPGAAAGSGGAVFADIARRVLEELQRQSGGAVSGKVVPIPGGGAGGGGLMDILGQIFRGGAGKFSPQGPHGQNANPGVWPSDAARGGNGMFHFAGETSGMQGEAQAELMLRAMIAAAQADGAIQAEEQQNILSRLPDGMTDSDREELVRMLRQPVDIDQLVDDVEDPVTALNLYLVSAMTIREDNAREHAYMDQLAEKLGIDMKVAHMIDERAHMQMAA